MKIGAISKADGTTFGILAERVKFCQNSKKMNLECLYILYGYMKQSLAKFKKMVLVLFTAFASYNRDKPLVVAGCALYAGYIATSMVLGAKGEVHWFSDAVAGTLMGASIGWYIGSVFYKEKVGEKRTPPEVAVAPLFYSDTKGAVFSVRI